MPLQIGTETFEVKAASLGGRVFDSIWKSQDLTILDGVNYAISIECHAKEVDGDLVSPELEFANFAINIAQWKAIEETEISGPIAGSSWADYEWEASASRIVFGKRTGNRFDSIIEGVCGIPDRRFIFTGLIELEPFLVTGTLDDTDDSLTKLLLRYLNLVDLAPTPFEDTVFPPPTMSQRNKEFRPVWAD